MEEWEEIMTTIALSEAQAGLPELIHRLAPGEEVTITENGQPVAQIRAALVAGPRRELGTMSGTVLYMAPDFDAPLDVFKDYMA